MSTYGYFRSAAENGTFPPLTELRACFLADETLAEDRRKEWRARAICAICRSVSARTSCGASFLARAARPSVM